METNAKIKPLNKQETLEEVAERYGKQVLDERKSKNLSIDEEIWLSGGSIVGFIEGAKWQQNMADKKYTKEDMWHLWLRCKPTVIVNEQQEFHEKELFENFIQSLTRLI